MKLRTSCLCTINLHLLIVQSGTEIIELSPYNVAQLETPTQKVADTSDPRP